MMRDHSFVGNITPEQGVFQHQTYLYYADSGRLSYEMFYQLLIRDFGNFGVIKLSVSCYQYLVVCSIFINFDLIRLVLVCLNIVYPNP